jgi:hypothetical protein
MIPSSRATKKYQLNTLGKKKKKKEKKKREDIFVK